LLASTGSIVSALKERFWSRHVHKARVVQFEISGADSRRLATFYSQFFGWETVESPMSGYYLVGRASAGLAGGIGPRRDGVGPLTLYVEVDDLSEHLSLAEELGGSIVHNAYRVGTRDPFSYAFIADPARNVIGLSSGLECALQQVASAKRLLAPNSASPGAPVVQFEIAGERSADLQRFYSILFGWQMLKTGTSGYARVLENRAGIAGAVGRSWLGSSAQLTVFLEVPDLPGALARAADLGGSSHGEQTMEGSRRAGIEFGFICDPEGTMVGVSRGLQRGLEQFSLAHQAWPQLASSSSSRL
jgi:predicted enzyme related to lactoylglutathione lyase